MELIDRRALLHAWMCYAFTEEQRELIEGQPVINHVPEVHAKWVNEDFPDKLATVRDMAQCSVCGELSHKAEHGYAILSKFCPNCGAKMDGGAP